MTKLYTSGINLAVEETSGKISLIPFYKLKIDFRKDFITVYGTNYSKIFIINCADLKNQSGALVGNYAAVQTYVTTFLELVPPAIVANDGASEVAVSGGAGGVSAVSSSFSSTVTFTAFPLVMSQKVINAPLTITMSPAGAVAGASVLMRFVADGVMLNVPKFVGCTQVTGSSGWDNTAGMVNLVQFQYDGTTYWFSVVQATGGALTDLQPPARLTSTINLSGNTIVITFNEDLLLTAVPVPSDFTGATVTNAVVAGKTVTLTLNPAKATGSTFNLAYVGATIRDLGGNLSPGFTDSLTVAAAVPVPIPMALQSRDVGLNEVSVGTYSIASAVGGTWLGGVSSTLNFVGDAIYETTDTTQAPSQGIIGLHPTAIVIGNLGSYQGIHVGIAYYGGAVNILQQNTQINYGPHAVGNNYRIRRTGTVFIAQKKVGAGAWTTFHTYSYSTAAPMSTNMILNDGSNRMSAGVY